MVQFLTNLFVDNWVSWFVDISKDYNKYIMSLCEILINNVRFFICGFICYKNQSLDIALDF